MGGLSQIGKDWLKKMKGFTPQKRNDGLKKKRRADPKNGKDWLEKWEGLIWL